MQLNLQLTLLVLFVSVNANCYDDRGSCTSNCTGNHCYLGAENKFCCPNRKVII